MVYSITDIPQADRLDKVIQVVKVIYEGATTDVKIAASIGFSDRQGRYYRHAAEVLGLIKNDRNNASLTDLGLELANSNLANSLSILRKAIYNNSFFKEVLKYLKKVERA